MQWNFEQLCYQNPSCSITEGYFYSRYKQSKNIHDIFPPRDFFRFFHLKRFIATDLKGTSKITIDDFIIFVWRLAVMLLTSSRGMEVAIIIYEYEDSLTEKEFLPDKWNIYVVGPIRCTQWISRLKLTNIKPDRALTLFCQDIQELRSCVLILTLDDDDDDDMAIVCWCLRVILF